MTARQKIFKQLLKYLGQTLLVLFITLCLFEISYRYYWIDFYDGQLKGLNSKEDLSLSKNKTVLVFGDSFSASTSGWISVLKDSLIDYNVINSAVPGTSVFHQKLFFEDRIEAFKPDRIIIQLYVGNDLIDYYRPINFGKLGFARNIYWWISDSFISLQYLNYKLGRFKTNSAPIDPKIQSNFSVQKYSGRVKTYLLASPSVFQDQITLSNGCDKIMESMIEDLDEMIASTNIPVYIVVVPHCAQVSEYYLQNYLELGAEICTSEIEKFEFLNALEVHFSGNNQVTILSTLPSLQVANSKTKVFFDNDPHLQTAGEIAVGNFVFSHFK